VVQIDVVYQGGLRTQATHAPSGATLVTDAPVDNHGKGASFSPTDLVATALGSCMVTIMGIVAERHGWELEGTTVRVTKKMSTSSPRRIGALEVLIGVPRALDEPARRALEKAALGCPVHATLGANVDIPVRFEWGS
jgi:uncharacterized OsmC-like protein